MKNNTSDTKYAKSERVMEWVIMILAALAGYLLAGCDGTATTPIPADESGTSCAGSVSVNLGYVGNESKVDDVSHQCVGWTAVKGGYGDGTVASCVKSVEALGYSEEVATTECTVPLTSAECVDALHDYADTAGVKHCLMVGDPPAAPYVHYEVLTGFGILKGGDDKVVCVGGYVGRECSY